MEALKVAVHDVPTGNPPILPLGEIPTEPGYAPEAYQSAPVTPAVDELAGGSWAGYQDYYGFDERDKWYFPDGKQWIEFKKLTEGDRAKYMKATRSDVHLNQKTQEARIPFDQSQDRKQLLLHSVTDWHIVRFTRSNGRITAVTPLPFPEGAGARTPGGALAQWIDSANPAILAELEKAIRKANPWLLNELSVEQIDKEISDLTELRKAAEEREIREKAF
jgi:hypothetical protein